MVVHQGLNKRYIRLSSLLEAELSAVLLDPIQRLSTLDQDLDEVLVERSLVFNPDSKMLWQFRTGIDRMLASSFLWNTGSRALFSFDSTPLIFWNPFSTDTRN